MILNLLSDSSLVPTNQTLAIGGTFCCQLVWAFGPIPGLEFGTLERVLQEKLTRKNNQRGLTLINI